LKVERSRNRKSKNYG